MPRNDDSVSINNTRKLKVEGRSTSGRRNIKKERWHDKIEPDIGARSLKMACVADRTNCEASI